MARLGFVDQEGNVSHITSSYTPKKKKKEEEVKINDNKSTDIRTVKTGKNLIDDAKIIKKGVDTGIISGLTGVADAPFQAAQEEIQKGKNIKSEKELLKEAALGILRASSPLANSILGNRETSNEIKKTLKDKDKSTLEKIVNSGLAVIGNEALDNTYQGAKAALRIGGAINPNLDKTVSNIQSFIDKPAETKQQELSQEIQNYSSPVQFLTTAGQTIGNMLPSIGATAITKDPSAGLSLMGVSAKGQATKEALQNGADITQANKIGTAKGLLEVGTELATGGLNIFGKGALDDITTNFINKKIGSKGLNFLAKQIAGVGGEIGEELVSDVVGTLIDRGTIDPNADYSSKEAKETILQTIATTLLLNGLTGGYTPRAYRQNAIEMQESRQNNGNVLNNNDTVIPDTNQVREVNEIQQKVENGEITYEEANQQMEQVQNGTYQQNQNNQVVIQEAQKQFDAINQAEANGIMDSETANQERQAIINTMNQMQQETNTQQIQQDTNTQENESYEPQEEKRQSPIDKLSDEEKEQLNTIYQKQANREKITDQDRKTLEYFTRKTNDLKNPELNKNITKFDDVKSGYKYVKNFDESKFDSTMVDKAKDIVSANKQGRRTKQQWLDVAKNIGMQADNLDSKALEKLAFESWAYTRPNQRGVLNRQGAQKVDFQIHEWVKAIYEGARVGERIESRVESPKIQVNQETKKTQAKEVETEKVETKKEKQSPTKQLKPTNTEDKIQNFRNSVENENIKDKDGFYKAVEKIIKDKDYNVILDSSITNEKGQSVNALITNDNGVTIKINPKSERAGEILLMHEVTHGIETKEMRNLILDYAKKNSEFNDALENLKEIYGTEDVTPEVVADISGQLLGNQEFINSLSVEKPTLFKRILDVLTSLKNKLTGNSKYENFVKDLEAKYREAYRKANQDTANQNLKNATKYSQNAEITDNKGRPLNINMQNYMEDSQATDAKGRLVTLYHTTTDMIKQFNEFDPANKYDPSQYKFGKYNVTYLTDNEEMSESYSMYDPRKADTRRLNSIKEAEDYLENTSLRLVDKENTNQAIKNHFKDNDNRYFLVGGDLTTFGEYKTEKELLRDVIPTAQQVMRGNSNFKYEVYANITKPFIIDAEGRNWDNIAKEINKESKRVVDSLTNEQKEELSKYANESLDEWQKWHMSDDYLEYKRYDDVYKNLNQEEQENLIIMSMKDNFTPQDYVDAYNEYGKDFNMRDPDSKIELNPYGEVKMQRAYKDFVAEWCRLEAEAAKYENKDSYFLSKTNKKYNQQLRAVGADKMFDMAKYNFKDWAVEDTLSSDLKTNDIVKKVIEMNENGEDYDGIIIKNTTDYGVRSGNEPHDVYVVFNSNQIKSVDNPDPTSDPDIRYSKKAKKWQEFLDKNFKERGTTTKLNDNKEITATGPNNQEVKLKEKNGVYTRQDVVNEVKNIENQFKNQTLKAKNGEKVSNFYSNLTEKSKFIEPETRESLKSERSIKFYKGVTNEQALQEAVDIIGTTPASQARALNNFLTKQDQFTATDMAEGWVFLKQYQDVGNYDAMASVAKKMREMGTKSGQAIQMLGLEARLTPEGMYRFAVSELAQAEEKYNKQKGRTKKDIEQHRKNFQLTPEETEFIKSQMEKVQGMEEGRARDIEVAKINKMLTDKLPHTKGQSLKAWMRLSMLFNPKTQVRNIVGNALITPVNALSDVASGAVDRIVAKKTGARTIGGPSLGGLASYVKGGVKGVRESWQDYRMGIDTRNVNQDRFDIGQGKQFNEQHRGPLKGIRNKIAKLGNKTNDLLAFVMDAGDRFFYQGSLENSLYNQQKLNKTKEITKDMYDLAENEGLQRTWNDNNQFTKAVLNIRKAINDIGGLMHVKVGDYGLGDLMIPFAKTPANLTKAIVDYSPAGFLTSITEGRNLKRAIETGNYTLQQQHDFSQSVGKATAGTLLYALGIALAKAKITTGDSDEDKDLKNFMRYNLGIQPYSIKIGNKSFTYDWAQPVAAPFAITADIEKGVNDEMTPAQAIQQFLTTGFNILTEQSFLSGINEVLNDNDGLLHGIEQQVINMPATAVPTLLKQFTDMIDATKRQTYSKEGMTENSKKYAQSKLPTESKKLAPQVDVLGNEIQKYGGDNNAFNVFLNPSNTEKGKSNDVSKEIYALYEATGDKTIIPKKVDYTITKDGKKKILTTQEMEKWQKASGKYVTENVRKAMNTPKYQRMSDVDKAAVINKIVNYSYMKAKSEIFDIPLSSYYSSINKAESKGIPMYDYYISKIKEG